MPLGELFDTCIDGIKSMVPVLAMLLTLFVFVEANDRLGLTPYVIDAVSPFMTAQLLPVVVFITVSLLSFTTGSNWGVIAITMPIALPLAQTFEVNLPLVMEFFALGKANTGLDKMAFPINGSANTGLAFLCYARIDLG